MLRQGEDDQGYGHHPLLAVYDLEAAGAVPAIPARRSAVEHRAQEVAPSRASGAQDVQPKLLALHLAP